MKQNIWIVLSLASMLAVGCGANEERATAQLSSELTVEATSDSVPAAALRILPANAEHLYFGVPTVAYVDDNQLYGDRFFTAHAGQEFKTGAYEDDGTGSHVTHQRVDFKLQRAVKKNGRWQWTVVAYGEHQNGSGSAVVKYTPPAGSGEGLYLLTAVAKEHPAALTLSLGCRGGTGCATANQPGESCGGRTTKPTSCDAGLFCNYQPGEGLCGFADAPGTCAIRPTLCTRIFAPVCGCDGKTYSNQCAAEAAGHGVLRKGRCEVAIEGDWRQERRSGAVVEYTFNSDGTFTSVARPACLAAHPACAVKLALGQGSYSISDWTVTLAYQSPAFHSPTDPSFVFSTSKGVNHLRGADYGYTLDLTGPN